MTPISTRRAKALLIAAAALLAGAGSLLPAPRPAAAHPLGNFTINHYSAITVSAGETSVLYVVDMAEIPAFQEIRAMDADHDGTPSEAETAAYLAQKIPELGRGLMLTLNGQPLPLAVMQRSITFPAGQGGLQTLRIEAVYRASTPSAARERVQLRYTDGNFPGRLGWKEIIASPGEGVTFDGSSVPANDVTDALRSYPSDRLQSPLDRREAVISYASTASSPASASASTGTAPAPQPASKTRTVTGSNPLSRLLARERLSAAVMALTIVIAFGIGAAHSLTPGHGKTIMAAYLVGARGMPRHAFLLGGTVAVSHTVGVLALGAIVIFAEKTIAPEAIYPYLGMGAGVIVLLLGFRLLLLRLSDRLPGFLRVFTGGAGHTHSHGHGSEHAQADGPNPHDHREVAHSHPHDHGSGNSHARPAQASQVTWRSLLAVGLADGIAPSASALLIWLAAISLDRAAFGFVLVAAFGLGMAAVLTGVGLLLVRGRGFFETRIAPRFSMAHSLNTAVPWVTSVFVLGAGLFLILRAMRQLGAV